MASEQIETPVEPTTSAVEESESVQPEQAAKDSKPRRQRTPPEELFDLTKPIPKVRLEIRKRPSCRKLSFFQKLFWMFSLQSNIYNLCLPHHPPFPPK